MKDIFGSFFGNGNTRKVHLPPSPYIFIYAKIIAFIIFLLCLLIVLKIVFGFSVFYLINSKKRKRNGSVLLLGPSGGGKTTLFYLIRDSKLRDTCTSLESNITVCLPKIIKIIQKKNSNIDFKNVKKNDKIDNKSDMDLSSVNPKNLPKLTKSRIIDLPGHPRLRFQVSEHLSEASCIIFPIDSNLAYEEEKNNSDNNSISHIQSAAELLFDILTDDYIKDNKIPIFIVINKYNEGLSKALGSEQIKRLLEKEISALQISRQISILYGEINNEELNDSTKNKSNNDISESISKVKNRHYSSGIESSTKNDLINRDEKLRQFKFDTLNRNWYSIYKDNFVKITFKESSFKARPIDFLINEYIPYIAEIC